ncbi:MAG: TIGR00730 family Rossman fold protein [Xanthomonadales bacterium]|jgi:hypothetical protein|nr:TIGR00730 family Rossman fold protein [Xanthomonadales bacterium]
MRAIAVYCGSSTRAHPRYTAPARELAESLVAAGITLVYGGGNVGLMGEIADAALRAGGQVIGVIPRFMRQAELAHVGLSECIEVESMHERKARMADRADAFIALPGGYGTLDELFEALTWTQIGLQAKPCGVLNVDGYFDSLLAMLERMAADGFLRPGHRELLVSADRPAELLAGLRAVPMPEGAVLARSGGPARRG